MTVGMRVGCGGGSVGRGPIPAVTGSVAVSPQLARPRTSELSKAIPMASRIGRFGWMGVKVRPERGLMVRRITGDERLSYDELPLFLQDPDITVHGSLRSALRGFLRGGSSMTRSLGRYVGVTLSISGVVVLKLSH